MEDSDESLPSSPKKVPRYSTYPQGEEIKIKYMKKGEVYSRTLRIAEGTQLPSVVKKTVQGGSFIMNQTLAVQLETSTGNVIQCRITDRQKLDTNTVVGEKLFTVPVVVNDEILDYSNITVIRDQESNSEVTEDSFSSIGNSELQREEYCSFAEEPEPQKEKPQDYSFTECEDWTHILKHNFQELILSKLSKRTQKIKEDSATETLKNKTEARSEILNVLAEHIHVTAKRPPSDLEAYVLATCLAAECIHLFHYDEVNENGLLGVKKSVGGRGLGGAKGNKYLPKIIYEKYYTRYLTQYKKKGHAIIKPIHCGISMELLSTKEPTETNILLFYSKIARCKTFTELEEVFGRNREIISFFLLKKLASSPLIGVNENEGIFSSVLHIKNHFNWLTKGVELSISPFIEDEMKILEKYLLKELLSTQFISQLEEVKQDGELLLQGSKIPLWCFLLERLALKLDGVSIFEDTKSAPCLLPDKNNRNLFMLYVENERRMTNLSLENGLEALIGVYFSCNMEFPKANTFMYDWMLVNLFRIVDNTAGGVHILKKKETKRFQYKQYKYDEVFMMKTIHSTPTK